ncbi:MAG: NAD+ synthase [Chitinispirillaceae bacterium]|nr:NAD+ synthase [Chitinispirillaceae bacterium]
MKITICQLNPLVGDVRGNAARVCECVQAAASQQSDLVVFTELVLQGYPPQDLLMQRWFIGNGNAALEAVCASSREYPDIGILLGTVLPNEHSRGKRLSNAAVLFHKGAVVFTQAKTLLPTYDVFDEARYFDPAKRVSVFPFKGERLGITVCEDAWVHDDLWTTSLYDRDPVAELASQGATLFVNIAASPFHAGKGNLRTALFQTHAAKYRAPFLYVNQIGGNDELLFDGSSMLFDGSGAPRLMLPSFREAVATVDTGNPGPVLVLPDFDSLGAVRDALLLGIRDYTRKCGFSGVLLGLSGGIDSALTCALAAQALGRENVWGVALPSRYSSEGSVRDAEALAKNLGIRFSVVSIEKPFSAFGETLAAELSGNAAGLTEENLQARIRGTILMALSNSSGGLLLTTGNKSELAVGYCTLYGDMSGGLSVIADLPKGMVYKLAHFINEEASREIIPAETIKKAPSAELRPDQKDQDTLPPYPELDAILRAIIEEGLTRQELAAQGFKKETVSWIGNAVARSEYKRRQAAPGLKVTPKAFGIGRRFPVAARYEW